MSDAELPQPQLVMRHEPDTKTNVVNAEITHTQTLTERLTCLPGTGLATLGLRGDRNEELNAKAPPAPAETGSSTKLLTHLWAPRLGLLGHRYSAHCPVDHGSPQRLHPGLVSCQSSPCAQAVCWYTAGTAAATLRHASDCQKQVVRPWLQPAMRSPRSGPR